MGRFYTKLMISTVAVCILAQLAKWKYMHGTQTLVQKYSIGDGWVGGYMYFTILNYGVWLESVDRPIPIVLCTNEQVKGLSTPWISPWNQRADYRFLL